MRVLIAALAAAIFLMAFPPLSAQQVTTNPPAFPALTGDCSTTGSAITCTKTSGVSFGTAATAALSSLLQSANNLSELTGSASTVRTNLGLGTISTQAANNAAITGGAIDGASIGASTAATGKFTSLARSGVEVDTSYSYQTPSTGFSITPSAGVGRLLLNPAGTLATGTVTMLAAPVDGQLFVLQSSQIITALTLSANAGQSILGAPTTLALGGRIECIYRAANTTWFC